MANLNSDSEIFYNSPKLQAISKDDYTPILDEEKQALGNISITDMTFPTEMMGYDFVGGFKDEYDALVDDIAYGALNMTYKDMSFIETIVEARVDNLNENLTDIDYITVKLNETLSVQYNKTMEDYEENLEVEGFLIYGPRLYPSHLVGLSVKENGTSTVKSVDQGNYSIDEINFLKFNYHDFFSNDSVNFTMYLIWEYNISIPFNNWKLTQYIEDKYDLLLTEKQQTITPNFKYNFNIIAKRYNGTLHGAYPFIDSIIEAFDIQVKIKVDLPDKNLLKSHVLKINDITQSYTFLDQNKAINTTYFESNNSLVYLEFSADYTIKFIYAVEKSWGVDRLVQGLNVRERLFFPSIIAGPSQIYLSHAVIFDSTISIDQVLGNYSQFSRSVAYFDANVSEAVEGIQNSLIFTPNATKKKGLEILLPYIIKGETCPFTIQYRAKKNLRVIIKDNINMPIIGLTVELYYYGVRYGTYISNNYSQPLAPVITDENGEFNLAHVPNGNYTLKIYQNNELIIETSVSAYAILNYVLTERIHFPLWIIIFGMINSVFIIIGLVLYKKHKKTR